MHPDEFRRIALSLPRAVEIGHMGHPDFRVGKRIFATLSYPDDAHGMVKLMPEQQQLFMAKAPKIFSPSNGKWGLGGSTLVYLPTAKPALVRQALAMAWRLVAPAALAATL